MSSTHHSVQRRRWSLRRTIAATAAVGVVVSSGFTAAGTVSALAPANDNFADRIAITKDVAVDLNFAEATSDPVIDSDASLAACGFDVLKFFSSARTLWFDFTPTVAESVVVSFGFNVPIAAVAVTGDPGSFTGIGCSGDSVFDVIPGVTYHIAAVDYLGGGATATMSIFTAPPPPTINATVDPYGTVDLVNNIVSVSGTYTCTSDFPTFVNIFGGVQQTSGPFFVTANVGLEFTPATCDGAPHPWSAQTGTAEPIGLFRAAPISVQLSWFGCNFHCANGTTPATTVRLKSVNGSPTPPPPPPAPTSLKVTVDRSPVLDRATNVVTLSGTFSCTGGDEAFISGRLRQVANNGIFIDAYLAADLGQCTGSTQPWTATLTQIQAIEDVFAGGAASLDATAYTCSIDGVCSYPVETITPVSIKAIGQRSRPGATPSSLPTGVAVNFDHRALLDTANNAVTVTGTIACSTTSDVSIVNSEIGQLVGRVNVRGYDHGFASLTCDGIPQKFSFQVVGANGRFSPGKATVWSLMFFQTIDPQGFIDTFSIGNARGDLRLVKAKK